MRLLFEIQALMKRLLFLPLALILLILAIASCEEIQSYPDEPRINYESFSLFITTDALGNEFLLGRMSFEFIDGDGNIGMVAPESTNIDDSLKYNLFMSLYDFKDGEFQKIEDLESQNFRIPFIERTGQNKTLKGTITVDLEYKNFQYDTIFYTFYITDRDFNRSNTDTTEVVIVAEPEEEDIPLFR